MASATVFSAEYNISGLWLESGSLALCGVGASVAACKKARWSPRYQPQRARVATAGHGIAVRQGRRPIPGGSAALGTSWPHTQGAEEEVPVLPGVCHLDYRVIAGEGYDHRIVADPPDLAGFSRPQRAGDIIDRDQGVAQQEGRRGPDEDVADPAAVAAVPAPREPVDIAAGHPYRSPEGVRLPAYPPAPAQDTGQQHRDHEQVHTEHSEQRKDHRTLLTGLTMAAVPTGDPAASLRLR